MVTKLLFGETTPAPFVHAHGVFICAARVARSVQLDVEEIVPTPRG